MTRRLLVSFTILALFPVLRSTNVNAQQFSAQMQITQYKGQTEVASFYMGEGKARLDRFAGPDRSRRVGSLFIDLDRHILYLVVPEDKMYLQVFGTAGIHFARGTWMFRPQTPDSACYAWVREADSRGISLRCSRAGQEAIDGRMTQRWDADGGDRGHLSLWYDPQLNFVVKVSRTAGDGTQVGYELKDPVLGAPPPGTFDLPLHYNAFTFNRLFDLLTSGQW